MFGSTIEYISRSFTNELSPVEGKVLADGSMHSFSKMAHFKDVDHLDEFFKSDKVVDITTPIYPYKNHHLPEILEHFTQYNTSKDACILLYADSIESAELNMLFQYHKISVGLNFGLDIFCSGNEQNITLWDKNYSHWSQMQPWQLREWISLFYPSWSKEWVDSSNQVGNQFLLVKNTDFLFNTESTVDKIFNHCNLTPADGLLKFLQLWKVAQRYIVNEFKLLDNIVNSSINDSKLDWEPISIIGEAIVQQRLRAKGYSIKCDGLNTFPTNSRTLYRLLEKCYTYENRKFTMKKLFYMGLESYEARYTLQLTEWNRRVFDRRGLDVVYVPGTTIDNSQAISVGQVLDAHGRSYFGMSQMMNLVQLMKNGEVTNEDVIYFEDMFQPGIESLPYIFDQIPANQRPRVFVRCLAQSIDPDDFVHVWGMTKWMGLYEHMVNEFVTGVLATNEEMVAHMRIAGWTAPIYNISGLAFGKEEVLERIGGTENIKPFNQRPRRVGFAARFDQEKQPGFFMDLIEMYHNQGRHKDVEFAIFSGGPLRSNNPDYVTRACQMMADGKLKIYDNISKNEYYAHLNNTRVLFNCALQDWVSNTVSEADTLGANVLYPAYRSFPETFANDTNRLYIPWSIDDAFHKLENLLDAPHHNIGLISDWNHGTIDRVVDIMQGNGEQWNRAGNRYRDHVANAKYHVRKIEL